MQTQIRPAQIILILGAFLICASAEAKKKSKKSSKPRVVAKQCAPDIAKTSIYFVPHVKDYCPSMVPCAKFKERVRMQGSGQLAGNKNLKYDGSIEDRGDCDTAIGGAGVCLIPFVSVAADGKYFRFGDIIDMPSLKGKVINLGNGKSFVHPGYLIVHDRGGMIKGRSRFDIFTGTMSDFNSENLFGYEGPSEMRMTDKNACEPRNRYAKIPAEDSKGNPNPANIAALENIQDSIYSTKTASMVASANSEGREVNQLGFR